MIQIDCSAYSGRFVYNGEEYSYSAAGPEDAEELSHIYATVAITKRNYKEKLNPGHNDFSKTGGMFLIHDKNSILDEISTGRSLFGILQNPEGRITAMLWVSTDDPAFRDYRTDYRGTLLYAREIIVIQEKLPCAAALMFYSMFTAMKDLGYTHSIGEVYKALTYSDMDGEHESNLLNERSMGSIHKTGAVLLERNSIRKLAIKNIPIEVLIEPQIVLFEYTKVLPVLERKLTAAGITPICGGARQ